VSGEPEVYGEKPESEELVSALKERLNKRFDSPEEIGIIISNIMARVLQHALDKYCRVALRKAQRPGSVSYWDAFHEIVDGGLKVIEATEKAYNWKEVSRKLKLALTIIEDAKKRGKITEAEAKKLTEEAQQLEQEVEAHAGESK
jgi:membrane peptidoglycan carboxypeptidase